MNSTAYRAALMSLVLVLSSLAGCIAGDFPWKITVYSYDSIFTDCGYEVGSHGHVRG